MTDYLDLEAALPFADHSFDAAWAESVVAVDDVIRQTPAATRSGWLDRWRAYLASPGLAFRTLRWRRLIHRHRDAWSRLESWIFVGERRP